MLPVPLALLPAPPPLTALVQVTPVRVAGKVSPTTAPVAGLGPLLLTTRVYEMVVPGTAVGPLVRLTLRLPCAVRGVVTVVVLLAGVVSVSPAGAATVAVLLSVPVASAGIWAVTVYVTELPGLRVRVSLM